MTAKEIMKHIQFSDVIYRVQYIKPIIQAFLYFQGKAKNNKWYPMLVYAYDELPIKFDNMYLNSRKERLEKELFMFIQIRQRIPGYKGFFKFVDYDLFNHPRDLH